MNNEKKELLRRNRIQKCFFYSDIPVRFSDYVCGSEMHIVKCFDIFEVARFEVLERFRQYLKLDGDIQNMLFDNLLFCVIKIDYKKYEPLTMDKKIRIKTFLFVEPVPILTFRQQIIDATEEKIYLEADIKVALVDTSMHAMKQWNEKDLTALLRFISEEADK